MKIQKSMIDRNTHIISVEKLFANAKFSQTAAADERKVAEICSKLDSEYKLNNKSGQCSLRFFIYVDRAPTLIEHKTTIVGWEYYFVIVRDGKTKYSYIIDIRDGHFEKFHNLTNMDLLADLVKIYNEENCLRAETKKQKV